MPGTRRSDSGSASTGHPATSAKRNTVDGLTPAPQPATTSPRGRSATRWASASSTSTDGARTPGALAVHGRSSERPGASTSSSPVGTSGSRNGRFRCTGPATGPSAAPTAREASARHAAPTPGRSVGTSGSWNQRTAAPKSFTWSTVCPAPVSRSSGGRSAVHTINGTRPWWASSTAGWKFAAAVPDVHSTITGRWLARASPRAKNDADRSSRCTCTRIRSSPASASASGAEREPGARQASVTPWRTHSSTRVRAKAVVASRLMRGCLRDGGLRLRARVHADRFVVGPGRRRAAGGSRCAPLPVPGGLVRHHVHRRGGSTRDRHRDLRRVFAGWTAVPATCARPTRVGATAGAGERVARHRRPRCTRGAASRPTSGSRRRSNATASTRSSTAGWRSRSSPPCPPSGPASTSAEPRTPSSA